MLDNIFAKSEPKEKLTEHTCNALAVWQQLRERYQPVLNMDDEFWFRSFIAVLFHDTGKVTGNFQNTLKYNARNEDHIRHEFISGMLLLLSDRKYYESQPESLLAVFSHHKKLNDDIFEKETHKPLSVNENDLKELSVFINIQVQKCFCNKSFAIPERLIQNFAKQNTCIHLWESFKGNNRFYKRVLADLPAKARRQYVLHKALLNIADWTSSASPHGSLDNGLIYKQDFLQDKIVAKLIAEGKEEIANSFSFRRFQQESIQPGSILAIAPTGSGKTEAALLWASQKSEFEKIIYLLPTRVTSNAIYQRLKSYFGKENCAVVHSSAFFFRKELDDTFTKTAYLKDRTFFRNVNVCTIDQILTQGFNLGFWEIKTFHLLNAKVIVDEIHLYEPYTLGLIIATITYLQEAFNTQFYIMTATMPEKLKALLLKILGSNGSSGFTLIEDKELLDLARNTFEVRDTSIDELEEEIIAEIEAGRKVLIVVNTVDEAIRLYQLYKSCVPNDNIICYHSRFIQKHRIEKEREILEKEGLSKPLLLIATQVVEVSLDIDFDVLFTENAPIDAIIQRAGRVNRKRQKQESKVIVFQHSEVSEKFIYSTADILDNTFSVLQQHDGERLTERMLNELVDEVYKDIDIESNHQYLDALKKYQQIQRDSLSYIKDNLGIDETYTREGLDTISVIPEVFKPALANASIEEKAKHELSIRRTKEYKFKVSKPDDDGFRYIECTYDAADHPETGLRFDVQADTVVIL